MARLMECPFCGSTEVDVPEVDVGVGMQQVGPASCMRCGAGQAYPDADLDDLSEAERRCGWYAPPYSTEAPELYVVESRGASDVVGGERVSIGVIEQTRDGWRGRAAGAWRESRWHDAWVWGRTKARVWGKLARIARRYRARDVLRQIDDSEGLRDEFGKAARSRAGRYG